MEKLMKKLKKTNKGFSLVELIIVIAIMAILIGIIGLAVIPYIEKARVGKDKQTIDTVYSAFQAGCADENVTNDLTVIGTKEKEFAIDETLNGGLTDDQQKAWLAAFNEGLNSADGKDVCNKLVSKNTKTKGTITCIYNSTTKEISVASDDDDIKSSNK